MDFVKHLIKKIIAQILRDNRKSFNVYESKKRTSVVKRIEFQEITKINMIAWFMSVNMKARKSVSI